MPRPKFPDCCICYTYEAFERRAAKTDEDVWTSSFHLLPFGRKMEILFDFPYRAESIPSMRYSTPDWLPTWISTMASWLASLSPSLTQVPADGCTHSLWLANLPKRWFPTWAQIMRWPEGHPDYEHSLPSWPQAEEPLQQPHWNFDLMSFYDRCLGNFSHSFQANKQP